MATITDLLANIIELSGPCPNICDETVLLGGSGGTEVVSIITGEPVTPYPPLNISSGSGSTSTGSSESIVTDGLFMRLDATNYTSGLWLDETVNGNNAFISGATWVSTNGGIFDLDGINDTIVVTHNSSLSLSTTQQRTMQVWVNFDALPTPTNRMIVAGKLSSNFAFDGYWFATNSNGDVVSATNGGTTSKTVVSGASITTGTWYLYTFISQITGTANTTKVYLNDTQYINNFHGNDTYSESNNLVLGYLPLPLVGVTGISYLNGKIGAVYFYTRGLTTGEITTNFNATKSKYGL